MLTDSFILSIMIIKIIYHPLKASTQHEGSYLTKVLQDRSRHVAFTISFPSLCPTEAK